MTCGTGEIDRQDTGVADILLAVGAFAVAFALRALTWPAVFTERGIRLVGADAHYHLRRIQWSVENPQDVLTRDPYVNFPHGGEPIWTPWFDGTIAVIASAAGQAGDPAGVEAVAAWIPPLLGAATVVAVYFLCLRAFGRRVGVIAAAALCVMPAHVHYSQIGFVDHHAAVAFLTTLLLASLCSSARRDWNLASATLLGCTAAACLLIWPGALLHVGIAQATLLAAVLASGDADTAERRAGHAAVAHGVAFLWVAPFSIGRSWTLWGDLSPLVLSSFQPLWLGLPALGFAAGALAWRAGVGADSRAARGLTIAAALGVPAAFAFLLPSVREGVTDAVAWFFRAEAFQAVVSESVPLLSDGQEFTTRRAHRSLTPLLWALPAMLIALSVTRRMRFEHRTLALWSAVLFAATLAQYRFANSFAVAWAITIACTIDLGRRALPARGPWRPTIGALAWLVAALLLATIVGSHSEAWGRALRAFRGEEVHPPEIVTHHESLVAAASWLRDHSPETAGWSTPGEVPGYGVLTAWGDGHVVRYVARRPVIQDNFGDDVGRENFVDADRYFAAPNEASALAVAVRLRIRYVLVRDSGSGHAPLPYPPLSVLGRLNRLRGSASNLKLPDRPGEPMFAPGLSRHRLVYESPPRAEEDGRFKLYEIVEGAHITGDARPGAQVEARVELTRAEDDVGFNYRTLARTNARGRYQLRVPYPSVPFDGQFVASGPYAIESEGIVETLRIEESAVRSGSVIEGPSFVR